MTRLQLLERLKTLQHMPQHAKRDITTVSAMLSTDALARHVELCEIAAGVPPLAAGPQSRPAGPGLNA